jgi:hypothetical protein
MFEYRFRSDLKFRDDALREHLAQLNSPLIERIKIPYPASSATAPVQAKESVYSSANAFALERGICPGGPNARACDNDHVH